MNTCPHLREVGHLVKICAWTDLPFLTEGSEPQLRLSHESNREVLPQSCDVVQAVLSAVLHTHRDDVQPQATR
jgi:hypothetical protein